MDEWPENDFRIFVGDLGNEVTNQMLGDVFKHKFKSFAKAKVIRKKNNKKKGRGFGFVSFLDPNDMVAALKTMNGKYCGTRPMKLRKSDWDKRSISTKKARKMRNKNELKLMTRVRSRAIISSTREFDFYLYFLLCNIY